ncbi:putative cytochrome b/b6, di-hem cytochrome, transmembrane, cytochrome b/b6-like domain superfamily [Helianthus anomalus]
MGDHTYLNKVYDWFEERLEIQAITDDITSKYVPPHVNIFCCLGGITLTCFLVQVATGFAMTFYYRPTVTNAFASVQYIMTEANFGLVNPISSSMVGKYYGPNDDPTCISCISHRWI